MARVLTGEYDNLPDWSPDGRLILFTRKTSTTNFDVCTIRPDGTGFRRLTSSGSNEGHAVWNHDGRILYDSGMYGFRQEAALYDNTSVGLAVRANSTVRAPLTADGRQGTGSPHPPTCRGDVGNAPA
ncbi:TolB family protein [Streptosporangium sp. NBC_01756]|uniref:TolB family protein n=1 Tax=Streptosporangium sp. NBC_01756 TaxID=2975950 RepID=UPI002DD8B1A1|nr:hypothetical protein [Streptosporangium sp. NBC_01756]WSC90814.1 hypothetical protein OIE48_08790 [Streptosporangium sp. NBC_01756]